jgi:hypothetical protein
MARHAPKTQQRDASLDGFCRRWGVSRVTFWNWQKAGKAPRVIQPVPGGRMMISEAEEAAWAERMAAESHKRKSTRPATVAVVPEADSAA